MQLRILLLVFFGMFISVLKVDACDNLMLTYSLTCASEGDVIDVTWTSSGCDASYEINISLLSLVPFMAVQSMNNNVNDGSEMFTIGAHPPGDYQFYVQVSSGQGSCGATGWYAYGPVFEIKSVVPVNFGEFEGELRNDQSYLTWETFSEINNYGFEIQHANDTKHWEQIGFVEGKGNSATLYDYAYNHDTPLNGINFYRIKQMDFNGSYVYSDMITLRSTNDINHNDLTVFPNPCQDEIQIFSSSERTPFSIFSSIGKLVHSGVTFSNRIDVSALESGTYYLRIDKHKSVQSFVKN